MNKEILGNQFDNKSRTTWNPFIPTQRDIVRTEELAAKNVATTGALTFFFLPAGLFYLNRGINSLKILGYVFVVSFIFGLVTEGNSKDFSNLLGLIGEQVKFAGWKQERDEGGELVGGQCPLT